MPKGVKGPIYTNKHQTLPQRLRYLRQHMKPYMTIEQLATASGLSKQFIANYETGVKDCQNMKIGNVQKLAKALECEVILRLRRKDGTQEVACQLADQPLPDAPKRSRKLTAEARTRALSREHSPWKKYRLKKQAQSHK